MINHVDRIGDVLGDAFPRCQHPDTEVRYKTFSDGTKHLCTQCLICGEKTDGSRWLSGAGIDLAALKPFDEFLGQQYRAAIERRRIASLASERRRRHEEYEEYIRNSPDWQAIRTKVMRRDDYLCQACMEAVASDVHHRNYTHLFDEVLYDLVAVCRSCHAKIHGKL